MVVAIATWTTKAPGGAEPDLARSTFRGSMSINRWWTTPQPGTTLAGPGRSDRVGEHALFAFVRPRPYPGRRLVGRGRAGKEIALGHVAARGIELQA